jgi:hypothetical protein
VRLLRRIGIPGVMAIVIGAVTGAVEWGAFGDDQDWFSQYYLTQVLLFSVVGLIAGATFDPLRDSDKVGAVYQHATVRRATTGFLSIALALAAQVVVALPAAIRATVVGRWDGDGSLVFGPLVYALIPAAGALLAWLVMFFVVWPLIRLAEVAWRLATHRAVTNRVVAPFALFLLLVVASAVLGSTAVGGTDGTGQSRVRGAEQIAALLADPLGSPLRALATLAFALMIAAFVWMIVELRRSARAQRDKAADATD